MRDGEGDPLSDGELGGGEEGDVYQDPYDDYAYDGVESFDGEEGPGEDGIEDLAELNDLVSSTAHSVLDGILSDRIVGEDAVKVKSKRLTLTGRRLARRQRLDDISIACGGGRTIQFPRQVADKIRDSGDVDFRGITWERDPRAGKGSPLSVVSSVLDMKFTKVTDSTEVAIHDLAEPVIFHMRLRPTLAALLSGKAKARGELPRCATLDETTQAWTEAGVVELGLIEDEPEPGCDAPAGMSMICATTHFSKFAALSSIDLAQVPPPSAQISPQDVVLVLDPSNGIMVFVLVGVILVFTTCWCVFASVDRKHADVLREKRKRGFLLRGTLDSKVVHAEDLVDTDDIDLLTEPSLLASVRSRVSFWSKPRGAQKGKFQEFCALAAKRWWLQMRTSHNWLESLYPLEQDLLVYTRPQRMMTLMSLCLSAMAAGAVFFGLKSERVDSQLTVAALSSLVMFPPGFLLPRLWRYINSLESATIKKERELLRKARKRSQRVKKLKRARTKLRSVSAFGSAKMLTHTRVTPVKTMDEPTSAWGAMSFKQDEPVRVDEPGSTDSSRASSTRELLPHKQEDAKELDGQLLLDVSDEDDGGQTEVRLPTAAAAQVEAHANADDESLGAAAPAQPQPRTVQYVPLEAEKAAASLGKLIALGLLPTLIVFTMGTLFVFTGIFQFTFTDFGKVLGQLNALLGVLLFLASLGAFLAIWAKSPKVASLVSTSLIVVAIALCWFVLQELGNRTQWAKELFSEEWQLAYEGGATFHARLAVTQDTDRCCGFANAADRPVDSEFCDVAEIERLDSLSGGRIRQADGCSEAVMQFGFAAAAVFCGLPLGIGATVGLVIMHLTWYYAHHGKVPLPTRPPERLIAPEGSAERRQQEAAVDRIVALLRGSRMRKVATRMMELVRWERAQTRLAAARRQGYALCWTYNAVVIFFIFVYGTRLTRTQMQQWATGVLLGYVSDALVTSTSFATLKCVLLSAIHFSVESHKEATRQMRAQMTRTLHVWKSPARPRQPFAGSVNKALLARATSVKGRLAGPSSPSKVEPL